MTRARATGFGFVAGVVAGAAILAISALARLALGVPAPPELIWDLAVAQIPGPLFSTAIDLLKHAAKPLLLVGLTLLQLLAAGLLGTVYALATLLRPGLGNYAERKPWLCGAAYGLILSSLAAALWVALADSGRWPTFAAVLGGLLAWALLQAVLLGRLRAQATAPTPAGPVDLARRDLLVKGIAALVVLAAGGVLAKGLFSAVRGGIALVRPARLSSYVTPNDEFYRVSKNLSDPTVEAQSWRLEISGLVARPLSFTLDELKALPAVTQAVTLECISNEVGGDLIGNAIWRGVPLPELLALAGVTAEAVDVALHAADGYSDSIALAKALDPATLLAYEMNGEPLPAAHGFPLRLLVPGIYGMKNVKWITAIEPVAYDYQGYWQIEGWSDRAVVQTTARIDVPDDGSVVGGEGTIGGIAFAGDRGIASVEVSFDGGRTWQGARLEPTASPHTWALWLLDWRLTGEGAWTATVRAVDGLGALQEGKQGKPFPDGATGYHRVTVTVRR